MRQLPCAPALPFPLGGRRRVLLWEKGPRYRVNLGMDYTSGSYGADEKTEILYMPLSVQAQGGPWTVRAVVPWLHVDGPAIILDGADGGNVGTRDAESASGMGDLSLSLMYSFEQFYDRSLFIDVTARVKVPTASLDAGLGTGEPDAALQLDLAQAIGPLIPFATIGYKWAGVPAGFKAAQHDLRQCWVAIFLVGCFRHRGLL